MHNHLIKDALFLSEKIDRNGRIWDSLYLVPLKMCAKR